VDSIVLAYNPPFRIPNDRWLDVRLDLQARLESPVMLLDMSRPVEELEQVVRSHWTICCKRKSQRVVLITVDCAERASALMDVARLWNQLETNGTNDPSLFLAQRWDSSDWAEFLVSSDLERSMGSWLIVSRNPVNSVDRMNTEICTLHRKQITELVWELRTLEVNADFAIQDSNRGNRQVDFFAEIPWGELLDRHPRSDDADTDRIVLARDGNCRSKDFDEVFPLKRIVPLLVNKYLGAFEYTSPLPVKLATIDRGHEELMRRINALLPVAYRGRADEVRTDSMGSAGVRLDPDGKVPWDKIWTSFCDLGLAGGPPHRGLLLEPVDKVDIENDRAAYQSVIDEVRRGISLVSGLETVECESLGWVGIVCENESMAAWMLRAIIAENVIARRERNVVFVPAGPRFTIYKEIKNIIVTIAKTTHFYRL
jgi:hypothetical protein